MRVNGLWNQPVNDSNERNSGKKCPSADPVSSFLGAKSHRQPRGAFWKDFHKRDVEHHSADNPKDAAKNPGPGFFLPTAMAPPKAVDKPASRVRPKANNMVDVSYIAVRSEEHTSELQSRFDLVCRLLLEKKKPN